MPRNDHRGLGSAATKFSGCENDALLDAARQVATVAEAHACEVDAAARFPHEAVDAMRDAKLLSAQIPREHGGGGCSMSTLARICLEVAAGCGSSGLVLAMHYSQLACLVRHGMASGFFQRYLRDQVEQQHLIASITSEVGTYGDTHSSICALEPTSEGGFRLDKEATTGSYCAYADAIAVTCRRDPQAPRNDQVLVLLQKRDYELTATSNWDTLGMRGTCSPGFRLRAQARRQQIVPVSFADCSGQSMVPYSHVLWAAVWCGIAQAAAAKAGRCVRAAARKQVGSVPPSAARLAALATTLQAMSGNLFSVAKEFDEVDDSANGRAALMSMEWSLKLNNLKISTSNAAPGAVHQALQITGVSGYRNDSPASVGRHYRDALSASLMISNDRIMEQSASMLLVLKNDRF
ncbi:MAG: acyl-CoA dehydrogenase family protein [Steroidobacteraceae bacterium]